MAITKVTNSLVATNAIQGTLIADNAITSVHIAQNQVTAVQIPDGSITSTQLGANSVDSSELVDGSIDTSHIADAQITTAKLGTNQVTSAKIAQNSIEARHIADGSITDTQLGSGAFTMGTITTTGAIRGPASLTIDPATVGDNTGTVVIAGNLQVDGTTTTVNSTTVDIVDKNITLGKGGSASANNGGGITIDGAAATLLYQHSDTSWQINKPLGVTGGITTAGNIVVSGTTLVSDDQTNDWVKQSVSGTTSTLTFGNTESTAGQAKWEYTRSTGRFKGYIGANSVTNFMSIDSSGRVGIGNSSPDFTLDVGADKDTWISRIYNTGSDASAQALLVRSDATAAHDATVMGVYADSSYKMVVRSTGRVGIGTASPKTTLNVAANNSGQGPILTLENTDTSITTGDVIGQIDFYANDASSNGTGAKVNIKAVAQSGAGTVTELTFGTSPSSSATAIERMRIDASGNIEIGTSNPSGNKSIIIQAGTDSSASLRLKNDAQDWDINCQTNDTFAIYNQTSSTQPFSILPNGKVGIGTATPLSVTQGLHVVHANNEGNPTYTGAEVGIFQRNFNSSQGAAISIVGGSNSESTVNFADKDDANIGQINYQHGTNSMLFRTNDTVQLSMSNTGKMIIAPAGNITKDYRTLWNTSSTGTHYIKLYDKTGTTPNKHLHFQMYSENNSEHSVEVKIMLPTYSGFLSNYGDYTAGQGPHVEILAGGLSSQANTFSEIIAVADMSSTNDYTEIWLKIDPPAANTAISIAEFPESEVITATTSDWTTTAPSNIQKRYPIVCGQHSINNVNIGQDGNVGIGTTSPNSLLEIKGSEPILTIRDTRNVGGTGWSATANEALGEIQFWTSDATGVGAHSAAAIKVVNDITAASPAGAITFKTNAYNQSGAGTERMRLTSGGILLVGSTSLFSGSTKLEVHAEGHLFQFQDSHLDQVSSF